MLNKRLNEWSRRPLVRRSVNLMRELNKYFYNYIPENVERIYEIKLKQFAELASLLKSYDECNETYENYERIKKEFFDTLTQIRYEGSKISSCLDTVDGFSNKKLKNYEEEVSQIYTENIDKLKIKLQSAINFLALAEKGDEKDAIYRLFEQKKEVLTKGVSDLVEIPDNGYTGMIIPDMAFYDDNCMPGYFMEEKWLAATLVRTYVDFKLAVYNAIKAISPSLVNELNSGHITKYRELFSNENVSSISLKIFLMNEKLESMFQGVVNMLARDTTEKDRKYCPEELNVVMTYINQLKILTRYFKTGTIKIDDKVECSNIPDENVSFLQRLLESEEFSGSVLMKK